MIINYLGTVLFIICFSILGCKNPADQKFQNVEIEYSEQVDSKQQNKKKSFVLSCGSGCAMTYNEENTISSRTSYIVKFKVVMYIDEVVADEYMETYIFECDESGRLENAHLKGEDENLLKNEDSLIRNELKKYGEQLCSGN